MSDVGEVQALVEEGRVRILKAKPLSISSRAAGPCGGPLGRVGAIRMLLASVRSERPPHHRCAKTLPVFVRRPQATT